MDIGVLSGFLAPFLPYLVRTGQDLGEDAARKLGAEACGFASRVWARLRPSLEARPAAQEAAVDAAEAGDDKRALGAFELQLEKLLAADAKLADDIVRLLAEAESAGVVASGQGNITIGGNVGSSTLIAGDHNTIGR